MLLQYFYWNSCILNYFPKILKNIRESPEDLKVTSTEVFWTLILNHQHDLHTIYHIVARNCHEDYIYSDFEGRARVLVRYLV